MKFLITPASGTRPSGPHPSPEDSSLPPGLDWDDDPQQSNEITQEDDSTGTAEVAVSKRAWPPSLSATHPTVKINWAPNARTLDTQSVYLAAVKVFKRVAVENKQAVITTNRGFVSNGRTSNVQFL